MERGHGGVTIGSEIGAGVENIVVKNCYFLDTDRGLRVKTRRGRGKDSFLNGITFENVRMKSVRSAFVINGFYYCGADGKSEYVATKEALPVDDRTPRVGAIKIKNVECRDTHVAGVYFYGIPESKIQCVELENVYIDFAEDEKKDTERLYNVLERQGILDKITSLTNGIDSYISQEYSPEGINFSGGERQKLAIARADFKEAPIFILDEPTSALDPIAEKKLYDNMNALIDDSLMIIISHRLQSVSMCDYIIFIKNGEMTEFGSHDELMNNGKDYSSMYQLQAHWYE